MPATFLSGVNMRLKDKVMLVTGGGSGIGQATVILSAQEGARVVVVYRGEAGRVETERMLQEQERTGLFIQADVRKEADWRRVMGVVEEQYGRLDILFSNAGSTLIKTVTEIAEEEWDDLLALNLKGVFLGAKHAIPLMIKGGGGSIVNMSSAFGLIGSPRMPAYCATRGGVNALTRQLAMEYAPHNIRVNAICPGPVLTPRIQRYLNEGKITSEQLIKEVPMKRCAHPSEIATAVVFMASDEASFMTGSIIVVDGGMTTH